METGLVIKKSEEISKKKPKKIRIAKKVLNGPEGSVELNIAVPPLVKELLEGKIKELADETGKTVSFYTLMQYLVKKETLDKASVDIKEKIREYEELRKKQEALGIHLV